MNTTYREFDTDSTSTPPSRSVRIARNSSGGFTLIELLVVISIIALLSTVVLAAVGDARAKARNSAKNSVVLEYMKALELYRSDNNGSYPVTGVAPVCFGYATGETCFGGLNGLTTLTTSMSAYLPDGFAHKNPLPAGALELRGVTYLCTGTSSCSQYTLEWLLEKDLTDCPDESRQVDNIYNTGHTYCRMQLQ